MNKERFLACFEKIKTADNILFATHHNPDGDAVGSICAMMELAKNLGKNYSAFCADKPPAQFAYIPNQENINSDREQLNFGKFDLIIALDCGSLQRTGLAMEIKNRGKKQFVVEIDHHPKADDYSDLEIRMPECSSTCEIIYLFIKENKAKINKNIADCLLTGIITDTGNFLYPSTSERTVKIASEMMLYGAQYPRIFEMSMRNKSLPGMKLWGKAINNLKINTEYNFACTVLSKEDLLECSADDSELEGVSGFLSNLEGVNGLLLLREMEDGTIKGSLRSNKEKIDISKLAMFLGGGGHKKASGFKIEGELKRTNTGWEII
jgi:bifunctional oligoribonuclease and PAP phosphatase NrnA